MKLAAFVLTAGLALAQSKGDAIPDYVHVTFSTVKPDSVNAWQQSMAVLRDLYKKNGYAFRLQFAPLYGTNRYFSVAPAKSVTEFDQGQPIEKMMGKAAYDKWSAEYRKTMEQGIVRLMLKSIPGLQIRDASRMSAPLSGMSRIRVAPGRAAEYEARAKNVLFPAYRKAGVKRASVWRVLFGAAGTEFVTFAQYSSLAEAEKVVQLLDQTPAPAGLILSSERSIYRLNPELSYTQ